MGFRRFEMIEGTSNKFWEVQVEGTSVTTRYGRVGTNGQETVKTEATAEAAQSLADKLVREKTKKGYVAVEGGSAAPTPAAPSESKPAPKKAAAATTAGGDDHPFIRKGQRLAYEVADFDAQDPALFTIGEVGDALAVTIQCAGNKPKLTFTANALEHAKTFLRLSQGTPYVDDREIDSGVVADATPPFLLSRDAFRSLKQGSATIRLGGGEDANLTSAGTSTIRAHVAGQQTSLPVLRATGDDAELVVLDDATWPVVLVWRHSGDCGVEIQGVGPKLSLGEDDALPDLPQFSSYADANASASVSSAASAEGVAPVADLLGRACDAFLAQETQWGTMYDPAPARALVDEAAKGALKGNAGASALSTLMKGGKGGPTFEYGAPALIRACLLAPPETMLPAAAQSLVASREIPAWIPMRPEGDAQKPHERIWSAVFAGDRCWTIGDTKNKTVVAEWNLTDGRVERVVDAGKRGGAIVRVLPDGTVIRVEGDKVFAAAPGKEKLAQRTKLAAGIQLGLYDVDRSGRLLAEIADEYDDDGNRKARVDLVSLESGKSFGSIDLGVTQSALVACASPERIVVTTDDAVATYRVGSATPERRLEWVENKRSISISPDGKRALIGFEGAQSITRLLDLESMATERDLPGSVTFVDNALLVRAAGQRSDILGLDGATRAVFPPGYAAYFGPGAYAVTFLDADRKTSLDVWRPVNIPG